MIAHTTAFVPPVVEHRLKLVLVFNDSTHHSLCSTSRGAPAEAYTSCLFWFLMIAHTTAFVPPVVEHRLKLVLVFNDSTHHGLCSTSRGAPAEACFGF